MKRILVAKFGACGGQACIAIDYVLVEKSFSSTLVRSFKEFRPFVILILKHGSTLFFFSFSLGDINEGMD